MPTGYTSIVDKGCTLREYALRCAHAFLIEMHDRSSDDEIADFREPDSYHLRAKEKAEQELQELQSLTDEQVQQRIQQGVEEARKRDSEAFERSLIEVRRYEDMKDQVEAWTPPTLEHENLKKFMLAQLQVGRPYLYDTRGPVVTPSVEEWRCLHIQCAFKDIAYHSEKYSHEVRNCHNTTVWVKALKKSLESEK